MFNFFFSALEKFDIVCFMPLEFFGWLDMSMTNLACYILFTFLVIFVLVIFNLKNSMMPVVNSVVLSSLVNFVFELVEKQMGKKGFPFFPFFLLLFLFILVCNLMGLVPFSFSPTAHLVLTLFFSMMIWMTALLLGFLENGFHFLKFFMPDVPAFMLPFLMVIEIFSYLMRVVSLALRLAANMTAGHVLLFTMAGFAAKLLDFNFFVFVLALVILSLMILLELGVAFLQAYVFVTLACIYFNDSLNMSA